MVPTKERNASSVFLRYKNEGILFDCGEGTQRQMNIAGIPRSKVTKLLISHWHGDHVLGIGGLLQTMGKAEQSLVVDIYGPRDTKKRMYHLLNSITPLPNVKLKISEANPKGVQRIFENRDYVIECASLKHNAPCIGYSFIEKDRLRVNMAYLKKMGVREGPHLKKLQAGKSIVWKGKTVDIKKATYPVKGKKIVYVADTVPCDNAILLAKDADLLISEASYASSLQGKAEQYSHLTAKQAALTANRAGAKKLVLTHFSQRYKTTEEIEDDARAVFNNAVCAHDFMKIKL